MIVCKINTLLLCYNFKYIYMNSRMMRRQVIRIAMSAKEMNKMDVSKALDWSYPTTLKKIKNPSKLSVDDAEKLCELIDLDIVKFIKPF